MPQQLLFGMALPDLTDPAYAEERTAVGHCTEKWCMASQGPTKNTQTGCGWDRSTGWLYTSVSYLEDEDVWNQIWEHPPNK